MHISFLQLIPMYPELDCGITAVNSVHLPTCQQHGALDCKWVCSSARLVNNPDWSWPSCLQLLPWPTLFSWVPLKSTCDTRLARDVQCDSRDPMLRGPRCTNQGNAEVYLESPGYWCGKLVPFSRAPLKKTCIRQHRTSHSNHVTG